MKTMNEAPFPSKETHESLQELKDLLDFVHKYPKALKDMDWTELIKSHEVDDVYKEWLWLLPRLTDTEATFFKPTWIPMFRTNYSGFIDFRHPDKPIFEANTSVFQRNEYQQVFIFKNINVLRLMLEFGGNVKKYNEKFRFFRTFIDFDHPEYPEFAKYPPMNLFERKEPTDS